MPLYMDFHIFDDVNIDEVKSAHIADKSVQDKYDVKYHQFWVNEDAGTVFCLMEGPDKASCEATHREAHGNIACKIEEVERGFYQLFMGDKQRVEQGVVRHQGGKVDLGYRFILVVDIRCNTTAKSNLDYKHLILPMKPREFVFDFIHNYEGKEVKIGVDDNVIAVFTEASETVSCAVDLKRELIRKSSHPEDPEWDILFKMGVTGGQPLTQKEGFFEEVIRIGQRMSLAAGNREILVSPLIKKLSGLDDAPKDPSIRVASAAEEKFLNHLVDIVEDNISNDDFNVNSLSRNIGVSRPQLYRKTTAIAGRSPNRFIRDLRMKKALTLLKEKEYNISEISLKVGIHNPSYFSKCFHDKYGIVPSKVAS